MCVCWMVCLHSDWLKFFFSGKVSASRSSCGGWHVSELHLVAETSWTWEVTSTRDRAKRYGIQPLKSGWWLCERLGICLRMKLSCVKATESNVYSMWVVRGFKFAFICQYSSSTALGCSVFDIPASEMWWPVSCRARVHGAWALVSVLLWISPWL